MVPISHLLCSYLPWCLGAILLLGIYPAMTAAGEPDRLAEALENVGFGREDLGCRPKGYWSRFPSIRQVPYVLPFFEDLLGEPLHLYEFSRVMAGALEEHLDPGYRSRYDNAMFKVVHFLGVEKKVVGPRGYDYAADFSVFAGPDTAAGGPNPVLRALEQVYAAAGEGFDKGERRRVEKRLAEVPAVLHPPLAGLIRRIAAAWEWRRIAVAELRAADMQEVFAAGPPRDEETFSPAVRRVAAQLDEVSLYHAAQRTVMAVEKAAREFGAVLDSTGLQAPDLSFECATPIGAVRLSGTGNDRHQCADCAVLVDLGGDDVYEGPVGSTPSLEVPIGAAIDLAGDDVYGATAVSIPSQGAAILGAGVLLDVAGKDRYEADDFAQGAGFFGLGLLWDDAGDDDYRLCFGGQGGAYFGIGLLVDGGGNDSRYLWGDGQGFGGVGGGVGVLADAAGDDRYVAEVDGHITGRGSEHTHKRVTSSQAQGAGIGRRGDISDGHAWAGGLGALVDLQGNDSYEAGNWAIGSAYWFSTGILYDGGGNDRYQSVYYALASGAHFCMSAVIDEAGDDQYRLADPPIADDLAPQGKGMNAAGGAGLAFGWDFTSTLLVDKAGDDQYEARIISGALAMIRSTAILADLGGNDRYVLPAGAGGGMGSQSYIDYPDQVLPSFRVEYSPASHYGANFGFLLDAGGKDGYFEWQPEGGHLPAGVWREGEVWRQPDPATLEFDCRSRGIGMDVEGGTVPEFHVFERRSEKE